MQQRTDYLKFYRVDEGGNTVARVYTGPDQERAVYSGTMVMETEMFERMLDALIFGVRSVHGRTFDVFFGPDDRDVA